MNITQVVQELSSFDAYLFFFKKIKHKKPSRCAFASFCGDRESLNESLSIVLYGWSYSSTIGCFIMRYLYGSSEGASYVLTTIKK